jgi:hypothetical protein
MARTSFWSAPNAHLRCSDAEREQVAGFLRDRAAEGRLTPDELAERVELAYRAVTIGELERLVADLPGSLFDAARPWQPARRVRSGVIGVAAVALLAAMLPGALWLLWWAGFAVALMFAVMALAFGLMLAPFALAGAAAVLALRRIGRRSRLQSPRPRGPQPPVAG